MIVGSSIPYLELFIPLVGAFALSMAVFCFPSLIDLCTWWRVARGRAFAVLLARDVSICSFGMFAMLIGTYTAVQNIATTMHKNNMAPYNMTVTPP